MDYETAQPSQVNVSIGTHIVEFLRHANGQRHPNMNGYDTREPHQVVHTALQDRIDDSEIWRNPQEKLR